METDGPVFCSSTVSVNYPHKRIAVPFAFLPNGLNETKLRNGGANAMTVSSSIAPIMNGLVGEMSQDS
jgi:hypothetical protein